jgi:hypothetical protein
MMVISNKGIHNPKKKTMKQQIKELNFRKNWASITSEYQPHKSKFLKLPATHSVNMQQLQERR